MVHSGQIHKSAWLTGFDGGRVRQLAVSIVIAAALSQASCVLA